METNVQTDKKAKKPKKFEGEASAPRAESQNNGEAKEPKTPGAARPRKWDYGIIDEAKIEVIKETASVKKDIAVAWEAVDGNPTVAEYMAKFSNKGDARHGLRVLSRRELIQIVHADGTRYPKPYVAPEPKVKAEKSEAEPVQQ